MTVLCMDALVYAQVPKVPGIQVSSEANEELPRKYGKICKNYEKIFGNFA